MVAQELDKTPLGVGVEVDGAGDPVLREHVKMDNLYAQMVEDLLEIRNH